MRATDGTQPAPEDRPVLPPVLSESRISLNEARQQLPGRDGKPPHLNTVFRWVTKGVRVNGQRTRLEAARVGLGWYTSHEALARFINTLSAAPAEAPPRTPTARRKASERAARELDALGV
jgi:hypothetical protein